MRTASRLRRALVVLLTFLLCGGLDLPAGRPGPVQRHPPGRRLANMQMLRFQDALASERWQEALALCSERVQTTAATWPSLKDFFTETMPIEHVLAQDFSCWSCATNFYGMFVTLSEHGSEPRIDWYWGLAWTPGSWVVDYPPVKLDQYTVITRAAFQDRDDRIKQIRQSLEPKVRGISTRLKALSDRLVVGQPMLFQLELVNSGQTSVHFIDQGIRFKSLTVVGENNKSVPYQPRPLQIMVKKGELGPNSSIVLAEEIDINRGNEITRPGKYFVRFDSTDLQVGQPQPPREIDHFGKNLSMGVFDFLPATNKFPSNIIEINVGK